MGQKTIFSGVGQGLKSARLYRQWSNPPGAGHKEREAIRKCKCQGLFEQISRFIVAVFWLCSKNKICFLLRFFGEKCCFFLLENTAQNVLAPKIF